MFAIGLATALLIILFLGLTVLRTLENRPNPNTKMLADVMDSIDADAPTTQDSSHAP